MVIDEIGQEIRKATFPNNIEERMAVAQEKINECGRVLISEDPDDNWEEFLKEEKRFINYERMANSN